MKQLLDKYEKSLNLSNSWQLERLKGATEFYNFYLKNQDTKLMFDFAEYLNENYVKHKFGYDLKTQNYWDCKNLTIEEIYQKFIHETK